MTELEQFSSGMEEFNAFPMATSCRLQNFDDYDLVPGFINETYFLRVRGTKGWVFMKVELVPLIYVRRPEYWEIEVVGCLSGFDLPRITKYETSFVALTPASGAGTKGIIIRGANKKVKVDF